MPLEFRYPLVLLLLLALPLLRLAFRRSLADLEPAQKSWAFALRATVLGLLIIAIAGPTWSLRVQDVAAIFVVDVSASVPEEARQEARDYLAKAGETMEPGDRMGIVRFADQPEVAAGLSEGAIQWEKPESEEGPVAESDLASALEFGAALLPADAERRIILLTDGNATRGDALATAARLGQAGVRVDTVPLPTSDEPEVAIREVILPGQLQEKEPFRVRAVIHSNVETEAEVRLLQNDFVIARRQVELQPGENEQEFAGLEAEPGFATFEVDVVAKTDTSVENNVARAGAGVRGAPRLLVLETNEAAIRPFAEAMRREGFDVEVRGINGAPRSLPELQGYDLLLLSDYSAVNLAPNQMELYRTWIEDFGGAMLMAGGENSFGVGGYFRTPIEQLLPVRMEHDDRQELPTVALLVILDRSGSMGAQVQGQTKMALANQGAVLAMNVLKDRDYFGLFSVDTVVHQTVPLARISSRNAIEQRILSVVAGGGGIYVYTSLVDASQALRDVNARIKHVILFSDAADAEEKFAGEMSDGTQTGGTALDLAANMAESQITTSVVALGYERDRDINFLRLLAERGNGRFYLTNNALNLPQIFTTETMKVAQSSLVEEPFFAAPVEASSLTAGIDWNAAPLLLGYNTTKPKPTARILLATEFGDPLLATWRYGLGQSAVFTSDLKSRWGSEWLRWPGYAQLWSQVLRGLVRRSDLADFRLTTEEVEDQLRVQLDAVTPTGAFWNELDLQVVALDPEGRSHESLASQVAPGRYETRLPLSETPGITMLSISAPGALERPQLAAHSRNYSAEYLPRTTDLPGLEAIAEAGGGQFDPAPETLFAPVESAVRRQVDLAKWFLIAALLLFPIDILIRRLTWPRPEAAT